MGKITWGLLVVFLIGCNNLETKKISSEAIYEGELKQINWKEIENYPSFQACEKCIGKVEQQRCFADQLTKHIYESLAKHQAVLEDSIQEKVWLFVSVSAKGEPQLDSVKTSDSLQKQLPEFKSWLQHSVENLPDIYPAQKRGIPVATSFKIPLVIQSE